MKINEIIRPVKGGFRLYSKKGKNLGTFDTHAGAEKHEREVQAFKHMKEDVTQGELNSLEKILDKVFGSIGIDVNFTRHFIDRINDPRNETPISIKELAMLFKKEYQQWGRPIAQMGPDKEAVMKDLASDINVPFALTWDRENNELDMIAKTIMRKKNFHTPDKEFSVEAMAVEPEIHNEEITLDESQDFHKEFGYLGYSEDENDLFEAEYQGRTVKLNKPMRGDVKKFKVYVKNEKGNVVKVNFGHGGTSAKAAGEKTMKIKRYDPARRRSFRARHNCENPGPKTKARYWSCRAW
jgi:hypothetical protein